MARFVVCKASLFHVVMIVQQMSGKPVTEVSWFLTPYWYQTGTTGVLLTAGPSMSRHLARARERRQDTPKVVVMSYLEDAQL
jgi:hypothetical protein